MADGESLESTRDLWDDFVTALIDYYVLLLSEIYSASEDKIPGVEASQLVAAIRAHGHRDVHYVADLDDVLDRLARRAAPGDLVLTLGAGSISTLATRLVERLREDA